jgi:DNA invertase Pin-like site-specific DNA recombinase
MRQAYLYIRCSTEEQKDGRSLKRQIEAGRVYAERHDLALDENYFIDLGVSAFHGANVSHGQLGEFIGLVKEGRIAKGSVLIVENLDRVSREVEQEKATQAIYPIVRAGVDLATTTPQMVYTKANIDDMATWLPLRIWLAQAADESKKKSLRVAEAHAAKRKAARSSLTPYGNRHPVWLDLVGQVKQNRRVVEPGRYVVNEGKAALVRKMFQLAADGYGVGRIAKVLNKDYPDGLTGRGWQPAYIATILRDRSVLGEFQPHKGTTARKGRPSTRERDGEPIQGLFPPIISEADFGRVQAAMDGRRHGGGRIEGVPNLFNGLTYDAADGLRMVVNTSHNRRMLVSSGAIKRRQGSVFGSISLEVFERAILGRLLELKPEDVTGKPNGAQDREAAASGRLAAINRRLEALNAKAMTAALDPEQDASIYDHQLEQLGRQRKQAIKDLEQAHAEAASRPADNLGEVQSLIQLLDEAPPEERPGLRQKIQAALRRVVEAIWVAVVVGPERSRVARVVVLFKGKGRERRPRQYVIGQRWPTKGRPAGGWWVDSWPRTVDLQYEEEVEHLVSALLDIGTYYHGEGGPWNGPDDAAWWAEVFDRPMNPMPEA